MSKIMNQKYMDSVRQCFSLNLNMPGSMETVDPNRFIPGKTPLILRLETCGGVQKHTAHPDR